MWELRCKIGLGKVIFCLQKSEVKINRLLVERILLSITNIEKDNRKRKGEACQVFRLLRWLLSAKFFRPLYILYKHKGNAYATENAGEGKRELKETILFSFVLYHVSE